MKNLILAASLTVLSIFGANDIWAQSKKSPNSTYSYTVSDTKTLRPSVTKRANELRKELGLDEKQTAEVKQLLNSHFEKASSIKAKREGDENFFENLQLKAARMEFRNDLKKILNKDQRKKLEAFREKRKTEKRISQK
ncbi:MAG: hypothetical protein EOP53_09640 [Sphingobacteriales bacterium]|nr:MAG: hypothetical protein EOP53_09640 [Sphingobacteriales bacterium]